MGAAQAIPETRRAGVAEALDLLAWEIELAGARCIKLDAIIGDMIKDLPADRHGRLLEGLHVVDLLAQHLTGLSAFARELGGAVPPELQAPIGAALDKVTLGALADRMSSALGEAEKGINDYDDAGDLDLF